MLPIYYKDTRAASASVDHQASSDVLQNGCSSKYFKIQRKAPALKAIFHEVADL